MLRRGLGAGAGGAWRGKRGGLSCSVMPRRNVPRHVTFGKQQSPPKVRSIATPETAYQSQAAKGFLPELLDFDGLLSSSGLIEGQTMPERTSNDVDTIPRHNAKAWQEKVQSLNTTVHELQSIVKEQQVLTRTRALPPLLPPYLALCSLLALSPFSLLLFSSLFFSSFPFSSLLFSSHMCELSSCRRSSTH